MEYSGYAAGRAFAAPQQTYAEPLSQIRRVRHVVKKTPASTRRLDDIAEIFAMDFSKIDAQGSELSVVRHGHRRLMQAVATLS